MKNSIIFRSFLAALLAAAAFSLNSCNSPDSRKSAEKTAGDEKPVPQETTPGSGTIVYFNLDRVIAEYDMANDLRSTVETKVAGIQKEINRRGSKLQSEVKSFQEKINKGLITRSVAEVQGQKLQEQEDSFNKYAAAKQQEIAEEQQVMLNQIANAVKEYVDRFNEEKQYSLILSTQGDILPAPVVTGDPALDITDQLITGLNDEYVKNKAKGVKAETGKAG